MVRRPLGFLALTFAVAFGFLTVSGLRGAQPPSAVPRGTLKEIKVSQEELKQTYDACLANLRKREAELQKSDVEADRTRARTLTEVSEWVEQAAVAKQYRELIDGLDKKPDLTNLQELIRKHKRLTDSLFRILSNFEDKDGKVKDHKAIRDGFLKLWAEQERLGKEIALNEKFYQEIQKRKVPTLVEPGSVKLKVNESRKVKVELVWAQYEKDELKVEVTSSDPEAVKVPATLKLNFDKNPADFEVELRSATKKGTFKVTLKPEAGDPITLLVEVK